MSFGNFSVTFWLLFEFIYYRFVFWQELNCSDTWEEQKWREGDGRGGGGIRWGFPRKKADAFFENKSYFEFQFKLCFCFRIYKHIKVQNKNLKRSPTVEQNQNEHLKQLFWFNISLIIVTSNVNATKCKIKEILVLYWDRNRPQKSAIWCKKSRLKIWLQNDELTIQQVNTEM